MTNFSQITPREVPSIEGIVGLYNEVADSPVRKFRNRRTAERRLGELLAQSGLRIVQSGDEVQLQPVSELEQHDEPLRLEGPEAPESEQPQEEIVDEGEQSGADGEDEPAEQPESPVSPEEPQTPERPEPQPERTARRQSDRREFGDELLVEVSVAENPKRAKSKSAARFDLYAGVRTVGEYLDAAEALQGGPRHRHLADIRWDHSHGFIVLSDPREVPELEEQSEESEQQES